MRSAKKVRLQSTIFHLIGRLISSCRFFSFIQKYLQADWFGAESRSLLAEQLSAAGDACVDVLSAFPFPTATHTPLAISLKLPENLLSIGKATLTCTNDIRRKCRGSFFAVSS